MMVELRLRGAAERLVRAAFDGFDVTIDGADTVIRGEARDEIEALGLIERAPTSDSSSPRGDHRPVTAPE